MILNLERFETQGRPQWQRLEVLLDALATRPGGALTLEEAEQLRRLYHRAAADLNRLEQGAAAGALTSYLEALVGRAYGEVHARSRRWPRPSWVLLHRFARQVPVVFRRHVRLFWLALGLTLAGAAFGATAVTLNPAATDILLPADYLRNPAARVQSAEHPTAAATPVEESTLAGTVIANNIRVSILALALGVTLGIGTGLMLFVNGVLVGAVAMQYARFGFGLFVAGWLLPHGAFEIPSVLIAGQAGFLLAQLLLTGGREPRWQRVRAALPELLTLLGGVCCLLLWAGTVEGFYSQHHAPEVAYSTKVALGLCELALLSAYLFLYGRDKAEAAAP